MGKRVRRVRPRRRVPSGLAKAVRRSLNRHFTWLGTQVTEPVFEPGASDIGVAEGEAYEAGYRVYSLVWRLFGQNYTKDQILAVVWPEVARFSPWAREQLALPLHRREVTGWIWSLRDGG